MYADLFLNCVCYVWMLFLLCGDTVFIVMFVIPKVISTYELIIIFITTISEFSIYIEGFNDVRILSYQIKAIWTP